MGDYKGALQVSPKVLVGLAYFEIRIVKTEVSCVRYLIGRIVKTYDYINRVVLNASAFGVRGYMDNTLLSCCYASP